MNVDTFAPQPAQCMTRQNIYIQQYSLCAIYNIRVIARKMQKVPFKCKERKRLGKSVYVAFPVHFFTLRACIFLRYSTYVSAYTCMCVCFHVNVICMHIATLFRFHERTNGYYRYYTRTYTSQVIWPHEFTSNIYTQSKVYIPNIALNIFKAKYVKKNRAEEII